ncbi:MAG: tRNA 2-thiocytidine biosynthesis protein TtcA [Firmicutes bacterium ADurb.Bin193]|nr:MAG: tRNA 2-thiocytidine biosynthesis protein TtcA [Firmicutes bacterium ADurb.Bin193]
MIRTEKCVKISIYTMLNRGFFVERYKEIERSIIKKFRRSIWSGFVTGINRYNLISKDDVIAVCISGGKDSMLLAKCMQEIQRHGKFYFGLEFLVMNPGYSEKNMDLILENAKNLNIPVKVFETNIFETVANVGQSPCYLCARMRRGYLYSKARELGCNKIALGHHFDDVIETTLMNMLYAGEIKTMMPKLHSTNFKGMELIRPLYMVREDDIISWSRYNGIKFIECACRFTEGLKNEEHESVSKRKEMKMLIKKFRQTNKYIDMNIFNSVHNVNLETIVGYRKGKERYSFLDDYDG